jgi:hypothetical protein
MIYSNGNCYLEMNLMFHSEWCHPTKDGTGDVQFEACEVFSDLSIGNHFKVLSSSSLKTIAKRMNTLMSRCGTLSSCWKLIYNTDIIKPSDDDFTYMISVEEITTKLDRQYYNITQVIDQFYDNYAVVLKAIETELLYDNLSKD